MKVKTITYGIKQYRVGGLCHHANLETNQSDSCCCCSYTNEITSIGFSPFNVDWTKYNENKVHQINKSQQHTKGHPSSSSSAFPAISLGFTIFGWDFCVCDRFNPTTEVAGFRLHGWCTLLLAFTCLVHECQDLLSLSVWWNACVQKLDLGLYSYPKEFWGNGVRTHVNSKGKNLLFWKLRGRSKPRRCLMQDSEPNTLPTELFRPPIPSKSMDNFER